MEIIFFILMLLGLYVGFVVIIYIYKGFVFIIETIVNSIIKGLTYLVNIGKHKNLPHSTTEKQVLSNKSVEKIETKDEQKILLSSYNIPLIKSMFASYPHAFAYFAMKYLYVHIEGINMPTCYVDEQGNMDSTLPLASCGMKYIKDIKELTPLQISTLLLHSNEFPEKEKYVLQQLEYNKICLEFNNKIIKDVLRSKYYIEFLDNHYITNPKLIKSKQYCLNNIDLFDSFICQKEKKKKEKEREFYKLCEDLNLNIIETEHKIEYSTRIKNSVASWELKVKGIPYYFFYHYYPTRFTDISTASRNVRGLIYDFKDGKRHGNVVNILSQKLRSTFREKDFKHLCFVCIPASTKAKNHARYENFSNDLCSDLGMINAFKHIRVIEDKTSVRDGGSFVSGELYDIDTDFFRDKNVILFDDVVTRGRSMQVFKELLEDKGATVICALSIGRTYSDYYGDHREPHPWTNEY